MSNFVHLHLHSDFSLLDGLGKIDAYMKRANEFGMGAVALTDHGALYGAINFYEAAHKAGKHADSMKAPGDGSDRTS